MRADPLPPFARRTRHRAALARAMCGALLLCVGANALSLASHRFVGRYDFGYAIRGDKLARPAQVFDDGDGKVYFEARPNQAMPAVFVGKELALLVLQPEGQYFSARTSASEFTLVLGDARAVAQRGGSALGDEWVTVREPGARLLASAEDGLTPGVDYGSPLVGSYAGRATHEQPVVFARGSATLTPEVLDALSALVVRIGHDTAIDVIGRNDEGGHDALATSRAQALRNALLARGVAARDIELAAAAPTTNTDEARPHASTLRWNSAASAAPVAPYAGGAAADPGATRWNVLVQDITLAHTLERWTAQAGYRLKWDAQRNFLIGAPDSLEGSFEAALKKLLDSAGIRQSDYPLEACIYANTPPLVRITRQGEQSRECEAP